MWTNRSAILAALTLVIVWSPAAQATNGIEDIGVSTQAKSRGGADVAVGDTALSQIDNPATLSLQAMDRFDFSGNLIFIRDQWSGPGGKVASTVPLVPLIHFGQSRIINDDLSWGWAFQTKAGLADSFRNRHLLIPGYNIRDYADFEEISIPLDFSYRLTDWLYLGVGGRFEIASTRFGTVIGPADVTFGRGFAFGGGFQTGLYLRASETLAFGLAYRSPTWFGDLSGGDAQITPLGLPAATIGLGDASIPHLQLPQRLTVGTAWDALEWLKLIAEARYLNYANSSFHMTTINTNGVPGAVPPSFPFPLGYKDQVILAAGAQLQLDPQWTWAAGYNYGSDPIAGGSLVPIADVITQHHITTGVHYTTANWWLGVGYVLGVTAGLHAHGASSFPMPDDFMTSSLSQTQHSIFLGFGFAH